MAIIMQSPGLPNWRRLIANFPQQVQIKKFLADMPLSQAALPICAYDKLAVSKFPKLQ